MQQIEYTLIHVLYKKKYVFETNDQLTLEILSHFVRRVCVKIERSIKITLYVNK